MPRDGWRGQRETFMRMGVVGDWFPLPDHELPDRRRISSAPLPRIAANGHLLKGFAGALVRGLRIRPAEAEVEYADKSSCIDVAYTALDAAAINAACGSDYAGEIAVPIWTTALVPCPRAWP